MTNRTPDPIRRRHPGGAFVIGHIAGAPVLLSWSAIVFGALLAFAYQAQISRLWTSDGVGAPVVAAAGFVVLLFVSIFLHELAPGLTARAFGIGVREYALTFWGGHTAFDRELPRPGRSAVVAVVGPVANLVLAGGCYLIWNALPPGTSVILQLLAYGGFYSGMFVGIFNLLPALPLDGGALLEAAVWKVTGSRAIGMIVSGCAGIVAGLGLIAWGIVDGVRRTSSGYTAEIVWIFLIGVIVGQGGYAAVRNGRARRAFSSIDFSDLRRSAIGLPAETTLNQLDRYLAGPQAEVVVVLDTQRRPAGFLHMTAVGAVPIGLRAATDLRAVMVALTPELCISEADDALSIYKAAMAAQGVLPYVPILKGGLVTGVIQVEPVLARVRGVFADRSQR